MTFNPPSSDSVSCLVGLSLPCLSLETPSLSLWKMPEFWCEVAVGHWLGLSMVTVFSASAVGLRWAGGRAYGEGGGAPGVGLGEGGGV